MTPKSTSTEHRVPDLDGFDTWSDQRILETLLAGQRRALDAVEAALPAIAEAARIIAPRIAAGGRLIYAGAGTSIRVAVQDGSELPATFGMKEEQLLYLIAGGRDAMFDTLADAEDDVEAGRRAAEQCTPSDVLIAVAASGRTPYTTAAAQVARSKGCAVIAVVNNANSPLGDASDHVILLESGAEVISGSTRLGAGTAQKAALNLLSTLVHTRLGAVHDGLMVNVQAGNQKLVGRAARIASQITGASEKDAAEALSRTRGDVKLAILLCAGAKDLAAAQETLAATGGNLRLALSKLSGPV
ncbi:MAG: N-acetylmuramic acid 6-phosphate etherase [Rhizobiales bacterium]|nr:N-acetylmuramic acid 6-phosphate etherase [Hyphomicrobiales bacterium]